MILQNPALLVFCSNSKKVGRIPNKVVPQVNTDTLGDFLSSSSKKFLKSQSSENYQQ